MNNPIRAFYQNKVEAKRMRRYSTLQSPHTVLEIGCGQGIGTKLIKKYWNPVKIHGIDLDPKMIARARKKNNDSSISFECSDVTELHFGENTFDAIFDFGAIHHIQNWRDCLKEIRRALKPGGEFILIDYSLDTFRGFFGKILKRLSVHPYKQMYTSQELFEFLRRLGFKILKKKNYHLGFLVVAQKKLS